MKALVIGPGYVGRTLAFELAARGHLVTVLRRGKTQDPEFGSQRIIALTGDISQSDSLKQIPPEFDWVVNCAGASAGGFEEYRRTYLGGAKNIVQWLINSRIQKYVYTSSTGVYAQNDGSTVEETSPTEPETDTGRVLVETEQFLLRAVRNEGFPAVILRVAGIYGPGRGYWFKQFLSGEARLEGDGSRILNMVHRDDVAGSILAALEHGRPGVVYNVADNEPVSQKALFEWLSQTLEKPMPQAGGSLSARARAATSKRVSNRRLRQELNYRLKYPTFREGFPTVVE